jgi:small subunit ribosomal protein S9
MDPEIHGYHAVGRRKRAIAKVWLRPRKKNATHSINDQGLLEYFNRPGLVNYVEKPLEITGTVDQVVIFAKTFGGGKTGQAGALRLGIARALKEMDGTHHATLRTAGMLTRDSRVVERKKYGLAGARKRFQFSKR